MAVNVLAEVVIDRPGEEVAAYSGDNKDLANLKRVPEDRPPG